ncbi:MAG: hypothetical protein ACRD13_07480, partial [Terriglobales bacterium]
MRLGGTMRLGGRAGTWVGASVVSAAMMVAAAGAQTPPRTARRPFTYTIAGHTIHDPYHWLANPHSAQTQAWITRQDAYTQEILGPLPQLREAEAKLRPLMAIGTVSTPVERGGRLY